ncbi:MAG: hypothetical protein ABH805_00585 [Candidatus Nealsonbacteria bacterium]
MLSEKVRKTWFYPSTLLLAIFVSCFLFVPKEVEALGISPPSVINHQLLRGTHFEETVYINQGDPKEVLQAVAKINVAEKMAGWVNLKPGNEFNIPITRLFPVIVAIDIPSDAELGSYEGEIRIITHPETQEEGQVTIGIGIVINLDLTVVEKEFVDFRFIGQSVRPMEEGWPVKLALAIDNKGNAGARPDKVFLEIYNRLDGSFLGSGEADKFSPSTAEPFKRSEIIAQFSINLPMGLYWAQGKIYKGEEIIEYKIPFEVLEEGTLPREKSWPKWLIIVGAGILFLGAVVWFLIRIRGRILSFFGFIGRLRPTITIKEKRDSLNEKTTKITIPKRKITTPRINKKTEKSGPVV